MVYKWSNIAHSMLPGRCLLCGAAGTHGRDICAGCDASLSRNRPCCARCALPLGREAPGGAWCGRCRAHPPAYGRILAPLLYAPPLSELVTDLKYRGRLAAGRPEALRVPVQSDLDARTLHRELGQRLGDSLLEPGRRLCSPA